MSPGNLAIFGALLTFAGSVVAFLQPSGRCKMIGDGLAYAGLAAWFGGFLWWLLY